MMNHPMGGLGPARRHAHQMEDRYIFCIGAGYTVHRAQFAHTVCGTKRSHPWMRA